MKDENECCQICDTYAQCVAVTYQHYYQTDVCFPKSVCEHLQYVGGSYKTFTKMSTRKGNSVILYCIVYLWSAQLVLYIRNQSSQVIVRGSWEFFTVPFGMGPSERGIIFSECIIMGSNPCPLCS